MTSATCCHSNLMTSFRSWSASRASLRSMCWYTLLRTRKNCLSKLSTDPMLEGVLLINPGLVPKLDRHWTETTKTKKKSVSLLVFVVEWCTLVIVKQKNVKSSLEMFERYRCGKLVPLLSFLRLSPTSTLKRSFISNWLFCWNSYVMLDKSLSSWTRAKDCW